MESTTNNKDTKRIAKNTAFLYVRMLFVMAVTFYTSRVILDVLGVEDFGIYNVVGGFAIMFVFFRSSLANVTQRCLNIALGKKDYIEAEKVFSQHQSLYILMVLVVLVIAETLGLWMVKHILVIPEERLIAAIWVYQFAIVSLVLTLLSVVYESAIIAHEDMKVYSYLGVYEGLAKLVVAFLISASPFDKLIVYAALLALVSVSVILFYRYWCRKYYQECKFYVTWDKSRVKEAFGLISWNTIGTAVYAINNQGINILLNLYFGPVVNAARGIAFQLDNGINNFGMNFYTSVRPQLTKSYATGDFDYMFSLFYKTSKYSVFLMWILCLPLILSIDVVLNLWLIKVPEHTNTFTILVLTYSLINILNTPIWSLALAIGKLKYYILIGSLVFLSAFPFSWIFLHFGYAPESVFFVILFVRSVYIVVVLFIIRQYIPLSLIRYWKEVLRPSLLVILVTGSICICFSLIVPYTFGGRLIVITFSLLVIFTGIVWIGLQKEERTQLFGLVRNKIQTLRK